MYGSMLYGLLHTPVLFRMIVGSYYFVDCYCVCVFRFIPLLNNLCVCVGGGGGGGRYHKKNKKSLVSLVFACKFRYSSYFFLFFHILCLLFGRYFLLLLF